MEVVKSLSQPQPDIDTKELAKWQRKSSEVDLMLKYRKQIDESAQELSQIKEHVHNKRKSVESFEKSLQEESRSLDSLKAKRDRLRDLLRQSNTEEGGE